MDESTDKLRRVKPCPICGGDRISTKIEIIQMYDNGYDKMNVWAFCRNCGHRGLQSTGRFATKQDAIDQAFSMWEKER